MNTFLLRAAPALLMLALSAGSALAAEPVYAFQQFSKGIIAGTVTTPPPASSPQSKPASTLGALTLPTGKRVGDPAFVITPPASNSLGAFSYVSSDPGVVNITGDTVYLIGPGTATVTASQAPSAEYGPASTSASLTVSVAQPPGTGFCLDGSTGCAQLSTTDKMSNITVTDGLVASVMGPCTPSCPSQYGSVHATIGKSSGAYYWEVQIGKGPNGWWVFPCGISPTGGAVTHVSGYDQSGGYGFPDKVSVANTVYGCKLNFTNMTFSWTANGVAQGTVNISPGTYFPSMALYGTDAYTTNFGQYAFKYPVPAGHTAGFR